MMKDNNSIRAEFSAKVSAMIGHPIAAKHVHSDKHDLGYYLRNKYLQDNHPVILNHYRGYLLMVIPANDWSKLQYEIISVQDYIDNSVWNYGYFLDGRNSIINKIHWQPFEKKGINKREEISRYLEILKCRTHERSNKYMGHPCRDCRLKKCPLSNLRRKRKGASWKNEIQEVDDMLLVANSISEMVWKRFGFKISEVFPNSNDDEKGTIVLFPSFDKDTVSAYFPKSIFVEVMNNPSKYDKSEIAEILSRLEIKIGIPWHYTAENEMIARHVRALPKEAEGKTISDLWRSYPGLLSSRWLQDVDYVTVETNNEKTFKKRLFSVIKRLHR